MMTGAEGRFDFAGMPENQDYSIAAQNNKDHRNGVSTLDLVLIQRHILGTQKLGSAYKVMAADANNDQKVTAGDIVEIRKLVLGISDKFANNTSWRFVNKAQTFADIHNPWPFLEKIGVQNFNQSVMHNDFVAVKIGDVNNSVVLNARPDDLESRNRKALRFVAAEQSYRAGDVVEVAFKAENFRDIVGTQFTLNFDNKALELMDVKAEALNIRPENLNTQLASEGRLALSWNQFDGVTVEASQPLFTLVFRATTNNTISRTLSFSSDITKPEAYTNTLEEMKLDLEFRAGQQTLAFELMQNNPNPFTDQTVIGFVLPESAPAKLTVFDVTGKVVKTLSNTFPKGYSQWVIDAEELTTAGVLFYELESNGNKAVKKMIYLKK